jgi:hypothetical protein
VFGRAGGDEHVFLDGDVAGIRLDANVEGLDLATPFADLDFQVTGDGLTIAQGGTTIATLPSLNQDITLRFPDGSASLRQVGAQSFELTGGSDGTAIIDSNGAATDTIGLGDDTASAPLDEADGIAGKVFLNADGRFTIANAAEVVGRSGGNESVVLADGVTGVALDANIERVDIPRASGDVGFDVTDAGLTLTAGEDRVATLPSLNQPTELRLADGNGTLTQTGAQRFDVADGDGGNVIIGPDTADSVDVELGGMTAESVGLAGVAVDPDAPLLA